jgi:hypothetical protein
LEPALQSDAVLWPFLRAQDETASGSALEKLICESAQPLVRDVIRNKLRVGHSTDRDLTDDQAADLASDVTMKLVGRLRELRSQPAAKAINNFRGYVAVMTYHACDEFLRQKYPRRYSLKNQLRYLLTHRDGLKLWESDDGISLCGYAVWESSSLGTKSARSRVPEVLASFGAFNHAELSLPDLVSAIFNRCGTPLELDELVSVVADLWEIKDEPAASVSIDDNIVDTHSGQAPSTRKLDDQIDQRSQIETLWVEIGELPLRQRIALLLSLRDDQGRSVLTVLPLIGVVSIRQIAKTLAMSAEQMATLWNQLPLEDATIAQSLGVTRQQVINLRKCARQRLLRRTAGVRQR